MEFDLSKPSGVKGLFFLGAALPLWIVFLVVNIINEDPLAGLIVAVIGGIFLIIGVYFMYLNSKESQGTNFPTSGLVNTFFTVSLAIDMVCIVIGNILML